MDYYLSVWRNYAAFSGRARRSEYWFFALFNFLALIVLELIVAAAQTSKNDGLIFLTALPCMLYLLASIVPSLAVTVRRLHDINKSGWWYFIAFVPFIGPIWLLILTCIEGTAGPNQYGRDPKGVSDDITVTA